MDHFAVQESILSNMRSTVVLNAHVSAEANVLIPCSMGQGLGDTGSGGWGQNKVQDKALGLARCESAGFNTAAVGLSAASPRVTE